MNKTILLLIIVGLLIFILFFGYRPNGGPPVITCEQSIPRELERMAVAIESATNQGSLERTHFEIWPQCHNNRKVILRAIQDRVKCSSACQENMAECVLLEYSSDEFDAEACVNIPVNTEFEGTIDGGPGTFCPDRRNEEIPYLLTPFKNEEVGVPNGAYILINKTPPGWEKPIICAYRLAG